MEIRPCLSQAVGAKEYIHLLMSVWNVSECLYTIHGCNQAI